MKIGGLQKFSLIDYPGKICAIVFTRGCNFRCPYCHNPELVEPEFFPPSVNEEDFFDFLKERKGELEAVTITGGEPCLQTDLPMFLQKIREMGYLTKLDTNGSFPERLNEIIDKNLIDYLAIDIKGPLEKYERIAGVPFSTKAIVESIKIALSSDKIAYEFRTTTVKSLLAKDDLRKIGKLIKGARLYILQKFVPSKLLDPKFLKEANYSDEEFEIFRQMMLNYVEKCVIR